MTIVKPSDDSYSPNETTKGKIKLIMENISGKPMLNINTVYSLYSGKFGKP